ncbi:DUF4229 domain-containing protein [Actinotalea sp. K2]|uniref:DUF4229 domain-containing protein n=1 Tax=Actinotalea sp. K2 TaxID=2939438 RepID=UPI002017B7C3|nr:DUF4229 domain-containing protein [Actinotalea sp. K2]MCL3863052.1 DUF4229 domain-containing protein [Actinotalea sp. K2]
MPLIVYSLLRLGLLGLCLVGLALAGMGGWLLVLVAALLAWAISYAALTGPRDAAATWLAERAERRRAGGQRFSAGVEQDALAEDAEADAPAAGPESRTDDGSR